MHPEPDVYYFAFGSNMLASVFTGGFRGIRPTSAETAVLHGYRLAFTEPGIPFFEPAFANLEEDPAARCEGVLYRITAHELDRLDVSEGARAYDIIDVPVVGAVSGTVQAKAFKSKVSVHGLRPTRRYVDVLIAGAKERGLSDAWVRMLEATPTVDRSYLPNLVPFFVRTSAWMVRHGLPDPIKVVKRLLYGSGSRA